MKNKILISLVLGTNLLSGVVFACFQTKQCCQRTFQGLQCITVCSTDICPISHQIEIQ